MPDSFLPEDKHAQHTCEHCGNSSRHRVLYCRDQSDYSPQHPYPYGYSHGNVYEVLECATCSGITLRKWYYHEGTYEPSEGVDYEALYPAHADPDGLPEAVANCYQEALRAAHISPNGAAVLFRRTLEEVCRQQGAESRNLDAMIKDLATAGRLPTELVPIAGHIRMLGNYAAHPDKGAVEQEAIPAMRLLCRAVLEYVYGLPSLLGQVETRFGQLVRDASDD